MRPRMLSGAVAVVLAGCAGVGVVPTGPGTYLIARHSTMGWSSVPELKDKAFEQAEAYCQRSGKEFDTISTSDSGPGGIGKKASAEVRFRCVTPVDAK